MKIIESNKIRISVKMRRKARKISFPGLLTQVWSVYQTSACQSACLPQPGSVAMTELAFQNIADRFQRKIFPGDESKNHLCFGFV
jgi:hypothetical protein